MEPPADVKAEAGKRVLISGAGVAGPALAWWLDRFGFQPVIVEVAPEFRAGGYMIDFWGKGFELAGTMGLLPEVERGGYHVREVRFVNADGSRAGGFSTDPFWTATDGRFTSLPRGALAGIIWRALGDRARTRFGTSIAALHQEEDGVAVRFADGREERFDLVIGADGLHSKVRELLFGPERRFESFLGYDFAAFTIAGYEPRDPDVYMSYGLPGRQVYRFTMREGRTLVLLLWTAERSGGIPEGEAARRALLRERFRGVGWECPRMLDALDGAGDLYVDRMSQIHLPAWSGGRVALVGDAAWAPSLLAGEGTGLAIIGAYVLAGELARSGGHPAAFAAYEERLRAFIEGKQKMASRFGGAFVPKTRFGLKFRNWVAGLLNVPPIARLALSRGVKDHIELPDYAAEHAQA
jgi:2-polyprenyl-6-methoxyphenol hydroxylase-like FAD-dependent oxidoreductase